MTPRRLAVALALALALAPNARASSSADSTTSPRGVAVASRSALFEFGARRERPAALDSIPHPWGGVAATLTAAGIAVPALVIGRSLGPGEADRGLFAVGCALAVVTPAAGHLYAGLGARARTGMIVRTAGVAVLAATVGATRAFGGEYAADSGAGVFLFGGLSLGAALVGGSALWDFASVSRDVDAANAQRVSARLGVHWGDAGAPQLAVRVTF